MPDESEKTSQPVYEICLSSRIDPERAAWLGNFELHVRYAPDGSAITVLSGPVVDQAALFGILNRIRDLGLKLVSVNQLEPGVGATTRNHSLKEKGK